MENIITEAAIAKRAYWVEEIRKLSGDFSEDTGRLEKELADEIRTQGVQSLLDHIRLCGDIPESYAYDSSEEKLYSKYTDSLLNESLKAVGLKSIVLTERVDAADVEVR
jgi:type II restriction enzyme